MRLREQPGTFGTFEQVVLPHLDAAYNLARWLTRREHDAEDVVQEAYLRAFNAFGQFQGGDARCWLLTIVRNTCYTWLARNRGGRNLAGATSDVPGDEVLQGVVAGGDAGAVLQRLADREAVRAAVDELPAEFREVLVLREFEGLSYQQIAAVAGVPVGTVMSRLARARARLGDAVRARLAPAEEA
jgi:RNA polymerase sigma-70 factor, ECF subfamily